MTAKEKLVPELRFPEFTNEWEEKKLAEIADIYSGGTPSTREKSYWNGDILWATPTDVTSIGKYLTNTKRKITKLGLVRSSAKLLPKNSILMTSRATIGEVVINKLPVSTNQGFKSFILKDNNYYEFIYYLLKIYRQFFLRLSTGSTFLELSMSDTKNMKVKIPSIAEQQKIGDFFYTIDQKLELQRKKIKQLKNYKKGMMQRIFNQEIRFKDEDGNEYPEWEEKRLGEIGDIYTGKTPPTKKLEYWNGEYPFITPTDITSKYINETERYLTKDGMNKSVVIPKYSLLVTSIASIGKNTINVKISSCNQQINYIKPNKYNNVEFLYYKISYIKNRLLSFAGQTATKILNKREFQNIRVKTPLFSEQKKIADLLSSLDKRIELEERKLKEFEEYKKGLMQRMFI